MLMTRRTVVSLALLLAPVGLLSPPRAAAQNQAAPPSAAQPAGAISIGAVDVDRLYTEAAIAKAVDEEIRTYRDRVREELTTMSRRLEALQQSMQQVAPDSPNYRTMRQEAVMLDAQSKALGQSAQGEINQLINASNLRVLRAVKDATAHVAQRRGLSLVVRISPPLPQNVDPSNPAAMDALQRQVLQQIALYAAPNVDITSDVLLQMDETFRSAPTSSAPTTAPANSAPQPGAAPR